MTSACGGTVHAFHGDVRDGCDGCSIASTCVDVDSTALSTEVCHTFS